MTLDPVTLSTTVCLPCGAGAITRGNALEITSCTCPLHSYPVLDSSALNVTCVPCSAYTPACPSSAGELPAPCPRTLGDPTGCQCALAPFSQLNLQQSSSSQCAASCLSGYLLGKPRSPLEGQPSVTGSPLYTNAPTWQLLLPDQGDTITSLATTGYPDDSILPSPYVYHPEYLFFVLETQPFVYEQNLLPSSMNAPSTVWEVFADPKDWQGNLYTLQTVAVSRWSSASYWLYVAALVLVQTPAAQQRLSLSIQQFNGQTAAWATAQPAANTTLLSGTSIQIVSLTHTVAAMGSFTQQPGGLFYLAYNMAGFCGGLMLFSPVSMTTTPSPSSPCASPSSLLEALTVRIDAATGYPAVYVIQGGGALYLLDLQYGTLPSTPLISSSSSSSWSNLLAVSQGLLLALHHQVQVSDTLEYTWLNLQGMPWGTAPSAIAFTGQTPTSSLLVAAYAGSVFTLPTSSCPTTGGFYWDGLACIPQTCTKVQACGQNKVSLNNQCVCAPGYYQQAHTTYCIACAPPFYCAGGTQYACPSGTATATLLPQSASVNDCLCQQTGQFYSIAQATCILCPQNTWCPNQWLGFPCPGQSATSTTANNQFPSACTCQPGYTGPSCAPCPSGYYCPSGTSATAFNMAIYLVGAQPAPSLITKTLLTYFQTPGSAKPTLNTLPTLQAALFLQPIDATNRTLQGLMLMLQLPDSTNTGWAQLLLQVVQSTANTTLPVSMLPASGPLVQQISINPPTLCLTGKTSIGASCVCAPGYAPTNQQCSPCPLNTFKSAAGSVACTACPAGLVAPSTGATACSLPSPSSPAPSSSSDTTVLIGGVVGGVVGLVLLLFLVYSLMPRPP